MAQRSTDTETVRAFQTDRFFESNGQWFFFTRETSEQGPFPTRTSAEHELSVFLRTHIGVPQDVWDQPGMNR